jgi:hypothetical protein
MPNLADRPEGNAGSSALSKAQARELDEMIRLGIVEVYRCHCGEWAFEFDPDAPRAQRWLAEAMEITFH